MCPYTFAAADPPAWLPGAAKNCQTEQAGAADPWGPPSAAAVARALAPPHPAGKGGAAGCRR